MNDPIPGTRARGKISAEKNPPAAPAQNNHFHSTTQQDFLAKSSSPNRTAEKKFDPARRNYFASLIPSFGSGLVKILRTSNNLKRDFEEEWKK